MIGAAQATDLSYKFKTRTLIKNDLTTLISVNASGMILGTAIAADQTSTCYLIDGTKKTAIKYPGFPRTFCGGINKSGTVVGYYYDKDTVAYGFKYAAGKYAPVTLGTLVVHSLFPTSISDTGIISGTYHGPIGVQVFTLKGKSIVSFRGPGTNGAYGFGVNNAGHVSMTAAGIGGALDAYFKHGNTFTKVNFPGASQTIPGQINNLDQIVGTYVDTAGTSHGYVYDGKKKKFYTVDGPLPNQTSLSGINDSGSVVGVFYQPSGDWLGAIGTGHIPK
jgi:hypothetical protein